MTDTQAILSDLAVARVVFQLRTIEAVIRGGVEPPLPLDLPLDTGPLRHRAASPSAQVEGGRGG